MKLIAQTLLLAMLGFVGVTSANSLDTPACCKKNCSTACAKCCSDGKCGKDCCTKECCKGGSCGKPDKPCCGK